MTVRPTRFIEGAVLAYLEHQIGSGNPVPTEKALEDLCKLYRRGFRIHPNELYAVQTSILGLSERQADPKVQRWVLNALAQMGPPDSKRAIIRALENHSNDLEIITAGVAALHRLSPATAVTDLRKLDFPGQVITLAALQHVRPEELQLVGLPVDIQKADPETIKAALVVVGLDRAPPNMFDPNYSNAEIIKVLGMHPNPKVSQYSVWAITENPSLSIADLGIDLSQVSGCPDNVRGWVYRLIAMSQAHCLKDLDFIDAATKDRSIEARLGLGHGVRDTFFDQLVPIVLDWLTREPIAEVRQEILDHVITHADRSLVYAEHAVYAYRRADQADRERMKGAAVKTALFPQFRQIDFKAEGDLFVTNNNTSNTFTFNNSQVGAVAATGTATNSGQVIYYQPQVVELLKSELAKAGTTIEGMAIPQAEKQEVASAIADAQADPNSGTLRRVVSGLSKAAGLVTAVAGAEDTLNQIIQGISKLAGFN